MRFPLIPLTAGAFVFMSAATGDTPVSDEVKWHKQPVLGWSDFLGPVNKSSAGDAASTVSIRVQPIRKSGRVTYAVDAIFHRNKSWCKAPTDHLLRHEQLHFDIAELYARLVRKKIEELQRSGVRDRKVYQQAIRRILEESNAADLKYDSETLHGAHHDVQERWRNDVHFEIMALGRYRRDS